jgi:hypothetical protein
MARINSKGTAYNGFDRAVPGDNGAAGSDLGRTLNQAC